MKKVISILLTLSVVGMLYGCLGNAANTNVKETVSENHTEQQETIPLNTEAVYDENKVMFMAQDRYDIEGDRYELYRYNYRGDLLKFPETASYIGVFSEDGLAPAQDPGSGLVGYVDRDGVFVINPKYDDASMFSKDGWAVVCQDDLWGAINIEGEEIIPCSYEDLSSFFPSGYAVFGVKDDADEWMRYGILDTDGNVIVEAQYDEISFVFDGYFCADLNYGGIPCMFTPYGSVIDFAGNELDSLNDYNSGDNDSVGKQYYFTNNNKLYKLTVGDTEQMDANTLLRQEEFDGANFHIIETDYEISHKRVATTETGVGYGVTENGKTVIPFRYDQIYCIGRYFVGVIWNGNNNSTSLDIYDADYKMTAEGLNYSIVEPHQKEQRLPDGYFYVYKVEGDEKLYGIIDAAGNVIVEPVYYRGITYCTYENLAKFPNWGIG